MSKKTNFERYLQQYHNPHPHIPSFLCSSSSSSSLELGKEMQRLLLFPLLWPSLLLFLRWSSLFSFLISHFLFLISHFLFLISHFSFLQHIIIYTLIINVMFFVTFSCHSLFLFWIWMAMAAAMRHVLDILVYLHPHNIFSSQFLQ